MSDDNRKALPPKPDSLLLKPDEAMAELRCSRATLFKLLRQGDDGEAPEIDSFLLAPNARRIPRASLEQYVARKIAEHQPGSSAA